MQSAMHVLLPSHSSQQQALRGRSSTSRTPALAGGLARAEVTRRSSVVAAALPRDAAKHQAGPGAFVFRSGATQIRKPSASVRVAASGDSSSDVYDAVIVGGGISGLTTAQALTSKHGITNFLLTEARERVGGNITSLEANGYVWEEGPNSFQPNDSMLQIAVSAKLLHLVTCTQQCPAACA